jgi:hypothetical protein
LVRTAAQSPTAPAAAVEPPPTAPAVAVEPAPTASAAAVKPAPTAPAVAVEPAPTAPAVAVEPAHCENCRVNPADGDSKYCEGCADDLKKEAAGLCDFCRIYPKDDDSEYCKKCNYEAFEALEKREKQKAEWQAIFKKEEAEKKRKADAMGFAIEEYFKETSRCAECRSSKKTRLVPYCDEHQGKINVAVEKRLFRR